MAKSIYLKIDPVEAKIYRTVSAETEGAKEVVFKDGGKTYREYFDRGLYGTFEGARYKEAQFKDGAVMFFEFSMKNKEGQYYVVSVPLFDNYKNIDRRFVEKFIALLPNLIKGEAYRLFPFRMEEINGEVLNRPVYGISIKTANLETEEVIDKVERAFEFQKRDQELTAGMCPSVKMEQTTVFGKDKWEVDPVSQKQKKDFLTKVLEEQVQRLEGTKSQPKKETPKSEPAPAEAQVDEEEDEDLPF